MRSAAWGAAILGLAGLCSGYGKLAIEINLAEQQAYLCDDGAVVESTPIASGRRGHSTPAGEFSVQQKELVHYSSMYGKIVDASGDVVVRDADSSTVVPAGCKFVPAPMMFFLRFNGAIGMHAGYLPGYPASHGCVRLPKSKAELFFNAASVGTPVLVKGVAPYGGPPHPQTIRSERVVIRPVPPPPPRLNPIQRFFRGIFRH